MANATYVERALFLIGDRNAGKSTQLRSMFLDWRLGTKGVIPRGRNVRNAYPLSNERWLYLRLTSPQESGETLNVFIDKCSKKMRPSASQRRWNFACALQTKGTKQLPRSCDDIVSAFAMRFAPERLRAVILSPDMSGAGMPANTLQYYIKSLRNIPCTEVITMDATSRTANGLVYSDFFDFT